MKAISRLLIMFLLMVSMTGFSLTTTDLSQNSDVEYTITSMVDVDLTEVVKTDIMSVDSFTDVDESFKISLNISKTEFVKPCNLLVDDVGWNVFSEKLQFKPLDKKNTRKPRDGINS